MKEIRKTPEKFVQSFGSGLRDDIYDINNEDFSSDTTKVEKKVKTTKKNKNKKPKTCEMSTTKDKSKPILSKPARRSMRLKSEIFVESYQNNVLACSNGNNSTQDRVGGSDVRFQEMAENVIDTIDTNAIVSMLSSITETETHNQSAFKRKRTESSVELFDEHERTKRKTESSNLVSQDEFSLTKVDKDLTNVSISSQLLETLNSGETSAKMIQRPAQTIYLQTPEKTSNNNTLNGSSSSEQPQTVGNGEDGVNITSPIKTRNQKRPRKNQKVVNKNDFSENSIEKDMQTKKKSISENSILNYFSVHTEKPLREIQSSERVLDYQSNSDSMNVPEVTDEAITALKETSTLNAKQTHNQKSGGSASLEPKKRGRTKASTQRVSKVKQSKPLSTAKYTRIKKLTKEQIRQVSMRKIPKDRLQNAVDIINEDDHPIWDDCNTSCQPYIFFHWNPNSSVISDQNIKLKYARQFLLRRDWISLSKILSLSNAAAKTYYPLLAKYAALLLAHTEKEQFNKFVQFLTSFSDISAVMKTCTKIPTQNE